MVRETQRRRGLTGSAPAAGLAAVLLVLASAIVPIARVGATDLCAALAIPEPLGLGCAPAPVDATEPGGPEVVVEPMEGAFAPLSRLTVRQLRREGEDALAWTDPAAWLERQMTLDTSGFANAILALGESPDSPFGGETVRGAVSALASGVQRLGRLALVGCDSPEQARPNRHTMRCSFTVGGLGLLLQLRLVARGDERWAIGFRSTNEQRQRHFEAIANSFEPA